MSFNTNESEKITKIAFLLVESQSETKALLKKGFSGLALQNAQLLEENKQLNNQLMKLQEQLESISKELSQQREQEQLRQEKKQKRKNRK